MHLYLKTAQSRTGDTEISAFSRESSVSKGAEYGFGCYTAFRTLTWVFKLLFEFLRRVSGSHRSQQGNDTFLVINIVKPHR